ncbi:MAG: chromosomal replication initiator protein DnaA [Acutalibacteraceae bacterium]|nr:chromosomal replication initiator protein DnaA [Acutalibacteraceae bacterium]
MALNSNDDIWNAVCEECKSEISEVAFDTFFKSLKLEKIASDEFVIVANNKYTKDIIQDVYKDIINNAVEKVMGIKIPAKFVVFEEEKPIIKEEDEDCEGLTFETFFTFDNFVVGSTNRFAHAASLAVAESPTIIYNPLVIYGPSGVGKTHLMLAIKNHIKKKFPTKKVEFVRGEDFTNQLIKSLHEGKLGMGTIDDFRNKYRNLDVLMVDDIQFIAGKESTQEEFFNTFNALYQNNKQIIVTLDRPLKDIKTLDERIKSRLSAGLAADITLPDFETRVGIINRKAQQYDFELDENLVFYIAEKIKSNTRQIEGVMKKINALIKIENKKPNISIVQGFIKDIINDSESAPVTVEKIISEVSRSYNISEADILSNRREQNIVLARKVAMYITREITKLSYKAIGEAFGKDHTTVLYSVQNIEKFLLDKPYEKELIDDIIKNLKNSQ